MSELTPCNFCNLRRVRARVKKKGWKVTLRTGWRGGKDVYVHPPDVEIPKGQLADDHELREKYCGIWMMEIPSSCIC